MDIKSFLFTMPNATFAVNMEKYAEIDGVKVHYTVEGEGKPLILMHGWGCNTTTLASVEKVALESHKVYNLSLIHISEPTRPY